MESGITRDDWLRALADAGIAHRAENDTNAVTIQEFAEMMGLKRGAAAQRLRALEAAGKATRTRKWVKDTLGRETPCIAYRLVDIKPSMGGKG